MKDQPIGKREREALEHIKEHHIPSPDQMKKIGGDLREVAHLIIEAARHTEDGDALALGRLLNNPKIVRFIALSVMTTVAANGIVDDLKRADAGDN